MAAAVETVASPGGTTTPASSVSARRRRRRIGLVLLLALVLLVWEAAKWLGGDPWRLHGTILGLTFGYEHFPPFHWRIADDLSLPHVWDIVRAFVDPAQRNGPPLGLVLAGQAIFTFREAIVGFAAGGLLGLGLAILFVHSRIAERALVPYVVASQTVPILAISPIIVVASKMDAVNKEKLAQLRKHSKKLKLDFYEISAVTGHGIQQLKYGLGKRVAEIL